MAETAVIPRWVAALPSRPGVPEVLGKGVLGLLLGGFVARVISLSVPALEPQGYFTLDGAFSVAANIGAGIVDATCLVGALCLLLPQREGRPAWTIVAATIVATIAAAALVGGLPALVLIGVGLASLRWTAYAADGTVRRDPAWLRGRPARIAGAVVVVLALGVVVRYGVLHPLEIPDPSTREIRSSASSLDVAVPPIHNEGYGPVRILGVEPGNDLGETLRFAGARQRPVIEPGTRAFRPVVVPASAGSDPVILRFSKADCRPGATARLDSVRVRYVRSGEQTMKLPLKFPVTLRC